MNTPFFRREIDRYQDVARVQIYRCVHLGEGRYQQERVADYETLSKGAAASARREIKRLQAA